MVRQAILAGGLLLAGAAPAAAWDQPLFDFRFQVPFGSGAVQVEARCAPEGTGLACRAEGRGPAGRGFQFEGRLLFRPHPPTTVSDPPPPARGIPRWF